VSRAKVSPDFDMNAVLEELEPLLARDYYGAMPAGTVDAALRYMFPKPAPYLDNPEGWINDVLGETIWSKQREICQSVVDNRYTVVKACHGPGKSFIASRIGCWWLNVHKLGDAFLVTSAPSWPQVQAILWREIRRAHRIGNLPGRITLECQWHMGEGRSSEELIGMGRKPQDYNEHAFQGLHARYILIILDESCGIPEPLWVAVMTLMTNENARVLAIGNPDDPGAHMAKICKPSSGWNVITIPAFDTPNFTGEEVSDLMAENLVTPMWVEDRAKEWGEGSPLWMSKVMAEFPDVSDEYLFTPKMIETAKRTELPGIIAGRYGMDVARFGDNKTVVYRNRGGQIRLEDAWGMADTMETSGKAVLIMSRHHRVAPVPMVIDVTGVGAGVFDRLREQGFDVIQFVAGARANRPDKFINRRAELFWQFRIDMENGDIDLDPEDELLHNQLMSIKWGVNSTGKIYIESKEDMRDRGVPSPDHADAAVYCTAGAYQFDVKQLQGSLTSDLLTMDF